MLWICDICGFEVTTTSSPLAFCIHRSWYVLVSVLLAIEAGTILILVGIGMVPYVPYPSSGDQQLNSLPPLS
jgi:hypothetical protein